MIELGFGWNCLECLVCGRQFPIPSSDEEAEDSSVDRCPRCGSSDVEFSNYDVEVL